METVNPVTILPFFGRSFLVIDPIDVLIIPVRLRRIVQEVLNPEPECPPVDLVGHRLPEREVIIRLLFGVLGSRVGHDSVFGSIGALFDVDD